MDALERFLDDLAPARIGTTFNQYRDADAAFDRPGAAQIRLGNLAAYLRARPHPSLMLVGKAALPAADRDLADNLFPCVRTGDRAPEVSILRGDCRRARRAPVGGRVVL